MVVCMTKEMKLVKQMNFRKYVYIYKFINYYKDGNNKLKLAHSRCHLNVLALSQSLTELRARAQTSVGTGPTCVAGSRGPSRVVAAVTA